MPDGIACGDCPDSAFVSEFGQQSPEHVLKVASLGLDCVLRRLCEDSPQEFIPFGDRELWSCSALTSLSEMVPTQEASSPALENDFASEPTSAITGCAESTPNPG